MAGARELQHLIDREFETIKRRNGKIALDTNAVIAYPGGNSQVVSLIEEADIIILPVIVPGELIYGALNSIKNQEKRTGPATFRGVLSCSSP